MANLQISKRTQNLSKINDLNELLFQQLEELQNLSVEDEKFDAKKEKIKVFAEVADRIIKNNEFALRVHVWNAHQKFRLVHRSVETCDE